MSRVIGFSLKLEGSQKTVTELGNINKALDNVSKQINTVKKVDSGILRPLFEGQAQFKKSLEDTNKVLIQQDKLLNNLGKGKTVDKSAIDALLVTIKKLKKEIEQLKVDLNNIKSPTINVASGTGFDELVSKAKSVNKEIMGFSSTFDQLSKGSGANFLSQISAIDTRLRALKKEITTAKGTGDTASLETLLVEERALNISKKETIQLLKQEEAGFVSLSNKIDPTSVIGMRNELSRLKKEFLLLSEAERSSEEGLKKFAQINVLNSKVSEIEQSTGDFRRNVGNYKDAVAGLIPTLERLQKEGVITQKALLDAFRTENKTKVDQLTKEVNELSVAFTKMSDAEKKTANGIAIFKQLEAKLKELNSTAISTSTSFGKFGQSALSIGNVITGGLIGGGAVVAFQAAFSGIRKAVDISAELSDVEADVRKTTGLTIEQVKQLEAAFKNIDSRTSTTELLKISAVAGQLGVTGVKGIEDFTKALNVVSVALGDDLKGGVDEISRDLSRLSNVLFGATTDGTELSENILHIGNSLNVLASTSAATGENIVDFASRIGRSLVPLGVTAEEVLALSATFDELSIRPEQGATAINNLIKDIGANSKDIAKTLQLNEAELKKAFNTDPLKAFDIVLKRITELSGGDKTVLLKYLKDIKQTGQGVSDVFLALGKNSDIFDRNLGNAEKSLKSTSSLFNEFNLKNENLAGSLDKLSKKLQDIASNPGFIIFVDRIITNLGAAASLIGEVFGAVGGVFERLTANVVDSNNKTESSFLGITLNNLALSDSNYIVGKSIGELASFINKEKAAIDGTIKSLQEENISKETKSKLIDELVSKYPDLLDKYDLEFASTERLGKIQIDLTNSLQKQTLERIKIKTKGLLEEKLINEQILFAEYELGRGLTFIQSGLADFFGNKDKVLEESKKSSLAKQAEIKQSILDLENTFARVAKNNGLDKIFLEADSNIEKVNDRLRGLINDTALALEDDKLSDKIKAKILEISKAADQARQQLNSSNSLGEFDTASGKQALENKVTSTNKLIEKYRSLIDVKDKNSDQDSIETDTLNRNSKLIDKASESLEALRRRYEALLSDQILNEFDKKSTKVLEDLQNKQKDIQAELLKGGSKDRIAYLQGIAIEYEKIAAKEKDIIETERAKFIEDSRNELIKLKNEVDQIINDGTKITIESEINTAQFDLGQTTRKIDIEYTTNLDQLKADLVSGKLTQEQFAAEVVRIDKEKLDKQLEAAKNYKEITDRLYKALLDTQLLSLKIENDKINAGIIQAAQDKQHQAALDRADGKNNNNPIAEAIAIESKKNADLLDQKAKYNAAANKYNEEYVTNTQESSDKIVDIQKTGYDKDAANAAAANQKKLDDQKALYDAIKNQALEIAQQIADTLFAIDQERANKTYENNLSNLEKEKAARLKLVKGNTAEEERINAEFDAKRKKIEKQKFEDDKKRAINEAGINGALAIVKTFASYGFTPIGAALAAAQAILTAIQIAKIKSTSFAEGGFGHQKMFRKSGEGGYTGASQAPRDHTGKRPVGTAMYHENEYTATEGQVNQNKDIFDIAEADRKRMQTGQASQLKKHLYAALIRHETTPNIFTRNRKIEAPVLYQPNYFQRANQSSKVEMSEDSIKAMSKTIAAEVHASIATGTHEGFTKATEKIIQDQIRNTNLKKAI